MNILNIKNIIHLKIFIVLNRERNIDICTLSNVRLFETPWTVAHQASLLMGILQARILEWVAMPSSRGSSQPRDGTLVS